MDGDGNPVAPLTEEEIAAIDWDAVREDEDLWYWRFKKAIELKAKADG